ncbi:MAG: hypothetical protein HY289_11380 [Planctomycetes bacterium]|nr:hypothetical protein [Planctomycetota bacterium]
MKRWSLAIASVITLAMSARADVVVVKTPDRGIQPQAVIDAKGNLHLLYFSGEPKAGNLIYLRRDAGKATFSQPIKVNSQDGSAIAVGTIRGGHVALGKNGRVHVAWNGSMKAEPKNPIQGMPMMYARLNDKGTAFEPQRNLMTKSSILDGGGSLAADADGNVYVAWHALGKDDNKGENNRKVFVSISTDEGKTFAAEKPAWNENTGACGCCGMRGFADKTGATYFIYRAASEKINRGMYVLRSDDKGRTFLGRQLDNWKIGTCPMSSEAFAEGPRGVFAAWENEGQIYFADIPSIKAANEPKITSAPGKGGARQHPSLAFNKNGDMILVWAEGTGWNRGGALAWQVYDKNLTPMESGRRPGAIPVWGLPSVIAEPNGNFTIFH